jgi:hypothetical protein
MPKASAINTTEATETEHPQDILDELQAGIACLLQLSVSPTMQPEEVGFIARALDATRERLQAALRRSECRELHP